MINGFLVSLRTRDVCYSDISELMQNLVSGRCVQGQTGGEQCGLDIRDYMF